MAKSDLSLRALELFRLTARLGSVQAAAQESGLSISTVSHHLKVLEEQMGVALLDHKRRPLAPTPQGGAFLKHVDEALSLLRKGRVEATTGGLSGTRSLRIGLIEDFDSDIAPELSVMLASAMPECDFTHYTRASHDISALLSRRRIELGLATTPPDAGDDLTDIPILRDPFVVAVPVHDSTPAEALLAGESRLPLLRYSPEQLIGTQIETHLRRLRISLPHRFEIESNQTIMAMIAAGAGWAICTPLCYARARRFHGQVRLLPFPGKEFARQISLLATPDCAEPVLHTVEGALRSLITRHALSQLHEELPWLRNRYRLLDCNET